MRALKLITCLGACVALAVTLPAQQTPQQPADQAIQLEAFTVTGSNVKRLESENVLPVTQFTTG
ncbi:MAG: hypothetical protein HS122_03370 [Opitutaceae bacterium]|nr:hypothetical protein [Opitutaceae bacterium]